MKKSFLSLAVLISAGASACCQVSDEPRSEPASASASEFCRAVERGRHYRVMESVRRTNDGLGQTVLVTNRYTILGNGINRRAAGGRWVDCHPVVQIRPGGVICTGAGYEVRLSPDLLSGVVEVETGDHERIVSRPLAIGFFDPDSGRSVLLAQIKECQASVVSNRVIFRNAFEGSGIEATVTYNYEIGRFHQDVTFIKWSSVTPADFAMGGRTRLEVITEFLQSPEITRSKRVLKRVADPVERARMLEPDLEDETLRFGAMTMHPVRAFPAGNRASSLRSTVPVAKRLLDVEGRTVLVEALEWRAVEAELEKLPRQAAGAIPQNYHAGLKRKLPERRPAQNSNWPTEPRVASRTRSGSAFAGPALDESRGFVLDYTLVDDAQADWVFADGQTYLVETDCFLNDVTIQSGAVIKFAGGGLWVCGSWTSPTGGRAILTAIDDNSAGATIASSTGLPSGYYSEPLVFDYRNEDLPIANLDIRYAYVGISAYDEASCACSIHDCFFFNSDTAVTASGGLLTSLSQSDLCNVEVWTDGDIWTADLTECEADRDSDGLPDNWEQLIFGSLSQPGAGDFDGDGMTNLEEYQDGTDPTRQDSDGDGAVDQLFAVSICRPQRNSTLP